GKNGPRLPLGRQIAGAAPAAGPHALAIRGCHHSRRGAAVRPCNLLLPPPPVHAPRRQDARGGRAAGSTAGTGCRRRIRVTCRCRWFRGGNVLAVAPVTHVIQSHRRASHFFLTFFQTICSSQSIFTPAAALRKNSS